MTMIKARAIVLLIVSVILCSASFAQTSTVTAIKCGRLINPADGSITQNAIILVRGDRVEQVGAGLKIPDGAKVIDLSNLTVLPGLIDAHTHILLQPEDER